MAKETHWEITAAFTHILANLLVIDTRNDSWLQITEWRALALKERSKVVKLQNKKVK